MRHREAPSDRRPRGVGSCGRRLWASSRSPEIRRRDGSISQSTGDAVMLRDFLSHRVILLSQWHPVSDPCLRTTQPRIRSTSCGRLFWARWPSRSVGGWSPTGASRARSRVRASKQVSSVPDSRGSPALSVYFCLEPAFGRNGSRGYVWCRWTAGAAPETAVGA